MKIGLIDIDSHNFPNLALMKLSAYHKRMGNEVDWFCGYREYDQLFASKVFSFTNSNPYMPPNTISGGWGFNDSTLPDEIEHIMPDYNLYRIDYALGFTTRGCIRNCRFCIVPQKEGTIKPHADIREFWNGQSKIVLLDNNILASGHGLEQLFFISQNKIKLDCNQGLDCRLIDRSIARLLSGIKWFRPIVLALDSHIEKSLMNAVNYLREYGAKPSKYMVYCIVEKGKIDDAMDRILFVKSLNCDPFAMPIDRNDKESSRFARWVNHKATFKTVAWQHYKG